jgi:membrane protein required for colicin V production
MHSLINIDTFFILILSISIFIGFLRGFVKEVISILALLLAAWVAVNYGSCLGSYFALWINNPSGQLWAGFLFGFFSIIIAGMIISRLLSKIFRLSLSAKIDRIFGAIFGCFRGAILLAIIVMGVQLTSFQEKAWWIESSYVPYAKLLADKMIEHTPRNLEFLNNSQRND